jgi:hemerythrin-like domain-containing protein
MAMKRNMDGPADTRMMGVVHDALRRDLNRLRTALTTTPYPEGDRKQALADHVAWLMHFLHEHHSGEDTGLYPMVRTKNPGAAELLDTMDADHRYIDPAMADLSAKSELWRIDTSDSARLDLLMALDDLEKVLLPHLEREENDMMPVVSASITQRDWHTWDQQTNIKPKPMPKLAEEGNWLLDGLTGERRELLLHEVPAVPRFIVMYGFGPGYRRRATRRWGASAVGS